MTKIDIGLTAELVHLVEAQDGADHWGNDMPVLATPVLLWLAEIVSMQALNSYLEKDQLTLGTAHNAVHLAPTPVGVQIRMSAKLIEISNYRLRFAVEGFDEEDMIYKGTHDRAIVSISDFQQRVEHKRTRLVHL